MAVKLRFKRFGRRHCAVYRLTATDSRTPRDGRVLEELGFYDPENQVKDQQVRLNVDRIKHWLAAGAVPSETVGDLLRKNGISATKAK